MSRSVCQWNSNVSSGHLFTFPFLSGQCAPVAMSISGLFRIFHQTGKWPTKLSILSSAPQTASIFIGSRFPNEINQFGVLLFQCFWTLSFGTAMAQKCRTKSNVEFAEAKINWSESQCILWEFSFERKIMSFQLKWVTHFAFIQMPLKSDRFRWLERSEDFDHSRWGAN